MLGKGITKKLLFSAKAVPPPFLHGKRAPGIAGLIRLNDEISYESKNVLFKSYFSNNCFQTDHIGEVESLEVVSDETVRWAHDRTQIEAGAGLLLKTAIHIPSKSPSRESVIFPCAIVSHFTHIGTSNDNRNYHANQAKEACQLHGEEWIVSTHENKKGLVITAHAVTEEAPLQVSQGYIALNESRRFTVHAKSSNLRIDKIPPNQKEQLFNQNIYFPLLLKAPVLESFVLADRSSDSIICGVSLAKTPAGLRAVDPYVTMDCPEGEEKSCLTSLVGELASRNGAKKCDILFSSNDKFLSSILTDNNEDCDSIIFSALPIGLDQDDQHAVISAP